MAKEEIQALPKGTKVPNHIAIIPDGNRRWARAKGLHTFKGHKKGFDQAVAVSRAARHYGVHTVTLWGFSTENWDRTPSEISYLMKLYQKLIDDYLKEAQKEGVKMIHLGRKDRLPQALLKKLQDAEKQTQNNKKHIVNIALDYGGQDEIIRAVTSMVKDGVKSTEISKELMEKYLDTKGQPYPKVDLLIRSSGEQRTSGFLLWQSAYTETYWLNEHFPDFTADKLREAILDYSRRRRRFGGNDEEEHLLFDPEQIAKLEISWWKLRKIPKDLNFRSYLMEHLKRQYGLSKEIAKDAAKYMLEARIIEMGSHDWEKAKMKLTKYYSILKKRLKLAFEPKIVAGLQAKLWEDMAKSVSPETKEEAEEIAKQLYAELYRISLFQAAKAAKHMILAKMERNLAEDGNGEEHWKRAERHLADFYKSLNERIA